MSKTLNARNAKNNFEKYYKQRLQSTETDLIKFKEYLEIFKNLGKEKSYEGLLCWIWVILSKYKEIEYTSLLKGNSGNAKFMMMRVLEDGDDTKPYEIFTKFELLDTGKKCDNMLIDNINGFIINLLPKPHNNSFMRYRDSCRSLVVCELEKSTNIITKKTPVNFPLEDIMIIKEGDICSNLIIRMFYEECMKDNKLKTTRVSFHDAIKHEDSLSSYIRTFLDDCMESNTNNLMLNFNNALEILFDSISNLGRNYGFCHNDAHLGNVLVSKKGNRLNFVLIDYGRVLFDETLFSHDQDWEVKNRIEFELLKDYPFNPKICQKKKNVSGGTLNTWRSGKRVYSNALELKVSSSNLGEPGISNPGWSLRSPAHTSARYTVSTPDTGYPADLRAGIGRGGGLGRFLPQPVKCPAERTILCMVAHTALTGRESNAGNGKEIGWGPRDIIIIILSNI